MTKVHGGEALQMIIIHTFGTDYGDYTLDPHLMAISTTRGTALLGLCEVTPESGWYRIDK